MPTEYLGITGGTWWFNPDGDESCSDPTVEGPDGPIATIHHITRVVGEGAECHVEYGHFEDGYVIAAAPDMYACLDNLMGLMATIKVQGLRIGDMHIDTDPQLIADLIAGNITQITACMRKARGGLDECGNPYLTEGSDA